MKFVRWYFVFVVVSCLVSDHVLSAEVSSACNNLKAIVESRISISGCATSNYQISVKESAGQCIVKHRVGNINTLSWHYHYSFNAQKNKYIPYKISNFSKSRMLSAIHCLQIEKYRALGEESKISNYLSSIYYAMIESSCSIAYGSNFFTIYSSEEVAHAIYQCGILQ